MWWSSCLRYRMTSATLGSPVHAHGCAPLSISCAHHTRTCPLFPRPCAQAVIHSDPAIRTQAMLHLRRLLAACLDE